MLAKLVYTNLYCSMEDNKTPAWLQEPWLNYSRICQKLYGTDDRKYTGIFAQKRSGKRPWKPEELEQLERIRQDLEKKIKNC